MFRLQETNGDSSDRASDKHWKKLAKEPQSDTGGLITHAIGMRVTAPGRQLPGGAGVARLETLQHLRNKELATGVAPFS